MYTLVAFFVVGGAEGEQLLAKITSTFSSTHTSVYVESTYELSNVVLKFCDGSADYKFDGLRGYAGTFSFANKELAGVWVKSGSNASGDGAGYGEFFPHVCPDVESPTPTSTSTIQPTATPVPSSPPTMAPTASTTPSATPTEFSSSDSLATPTPTPTVVVPVERICYQPSGAIEGIQRLVQGSELARIFHEKR